jgi:hypothetical protein
MEKEKQDSRLIKVFTYLPFIPVLLLYLAQTKKPKEAKPLQRTFSYYRAVRKNTVGFLFCLFKPIIA